MKESEVAAIWQGFVHGQGTGWEGKVDLALRLLPHLGWAAGSRRSRRVVTFRSSEGEPTLFEIWVCADGYWADHTKLLCIGDLRDDYRTLEGGLLAVYKQRDRLLRARARAWAELDVLVRNGLEELGYPGQPSHPICHGIRAACAHEPPYPHQAGSGYDRGGHGLRNRARLYWDGGGGLRVEDDFLVTETGAEKLSSFPDGVVFR